MRRLMKDSYCTQFKEQNPQRPDVSLGSWGQGSFIMGRVTGVEGALSNHLWSKIWWVPGAMITERIGTLLCQPLNNICCRQLVQMFVHHSFVIFVWFLFHTMFDRRNKCGILCKVIRFWMLRTKILTYCTFKSNLYICLTVTFITFSIQMFYWKSWVCAIIPLFNLRKDITQRNLVEHEGLWIRIKVQWFVTVPEPGSYFDAPKPVFDEKRWPIMHQCYGQLAFLWFN